VPDGPQIFRSEEGIPVKGPALMYRPEGVRGCPVTRF
jgi:hypothetical protein